MQNKNTITTANAFIDITADTCPMTFVKTKLKIEKMNKGEVLEVLLNDGEPLKNVPLSAQELGHEVLGSEEDIVKGRFHLFIRKN